MNRRYIYVFIMFFLLGFFLGALAVYYLFPQIGRISNNLKEQSVYVVENKCEPIEEEKPECPIRVDVSGAVNVPSVYCFDEGSVVIDALNISKGLKKGYAKEYLTRKINLALPLKNNQKIYIPFEKDVDCKLQEFTIIAEDVENNFNDTEPNTDAEDVETACININTATKEQLTTLNGVGDSTAQKIIEGRPYTQIEDLLNVSGIGQATLDKFKDKICI